MALSDFYRATAADSEHVALFRRCVFYPHRDHFAAAELLRLRSGVELLEHPSIALPLLDNLLFLRSIFKDGLPNSHESSPC